MTPRPDAAKLILMSLAMFGLALPPALGQTVPPSEALPLTNALQVRALRFPEASRHFPVRLRGVVIDKGLSDGDGFVIQDDTAGIYLRDSVATVASLHLGDWVEVEGASDPGEFAPIVAVDNLQLLGRKAIPEPHEATFDELASGALDAQWVEVSGVVRYVEPPSASQQSRNMEIAIDGGRLMLRLNTPKADESLVDAQIRVRGVCYYRVNRNRQLLNPVLSVPAETPLNIEVPAPANPFDTPTLPVISLMQFTPQFSHGHRIHVRGVVTCQQPGNFLWIQDGAKGLCIQSHQAGTLSPGDDVDVLGFPAQGAYTPRLDDAIFRLRSAEAPPAPVRLAKAANAPEYDAALIEVEATVTERQTILGGWALRLRAEDGTYFNAILLQAGGLLHPEDSRPGSLIRAAGICSVVTESTVPDTGLFRPRSFQLMLRSAADIILIKPPPWWTHQHIIWLLSAVLVVVLLIAAGVLWSARHRLQKQVAQRRKAEAELSAILAERNRMAREIHDTLAQGLGAISLHLGIVKDQLQPLSEPANKHIEIAHNQARASLVEARNAIWSMRSQVLERGDIVSALGDILKQMTEGTAVAGRLEVMGRARRMSPVMENALLRLGQEAITNAIKHARPRHMEVRLMFADKQVQLCVKDDGCGFDARSHPPPADGFGLRGMNERIAELQGELLIESAPGSGTEVIVMLPLSS
jgi:signal transduction histidine kinase